MQRDEKIFVAGHRGLVGSALVRKLHVLGYTNIILKNRQELDLREQLQVRDFFETEHPAYVFLAAARVGGIWANTTYPADFIRDNLLIETNVIDAAYRSGVSKLIFLGSSCIYPKFAPQPMKEEHLLSGALEPTNEWYAIAKIAGLKMCAAYRRQYGFDAISAMPTNLYGPNDNFTSDASHVIPALLRKFHDAVISNNNEVIVWGDGTPLREFMHVDDLADACIHLMNVYAEEMTVNVGTGEEISIKGLAELVAETVGFKGHIIFDSSKPNGTPRKLLDSSRLAEIGWKPSLFLREGIASTYRTCFSGISDNNAKR